MSSWFLALSFVAAAHASLVTIAHDGQVFVPVRINGSRELSFLLDTAAPTSADPSIIRELKLQAEGGYRGNGTGASSLDLVRVPEVTLGIGTYDLSTPLFGTPVKQLEKRLGHTIDGILGAELFARQAVEIDYEHGVLRIGATPKRGAVRVPLTLKHGFPHAEVTLDVGSGPVVGTFLLDSGANTSLDIYKPFADAHSIAPAAGASPQPALGTGGESKLLKTTARSVTMGSVRLTSLEIYLPQDTEGLLAVTDVAGLVGTLFLRRFDVVIDEPQGAMYLSRH